ncbi:alpha-amylase family protein [Cohnella rhizosphaerae]|uniref:Beta-galactosidase n=1 Tax=Cohnella rhizosphaerae TaxID=1457232 RepID=A0A9X4KRP9_9BACL|nr:hypothetical protein [Cohnella rhizosphaerae]MDG0809916.1 beta-galactosidase [Cohnella rhizosphaerae]
MIGTYGDRRSVKDYQDFYFGSVAEYAVTLAGWMREAGIDCDLVHNSANPGSNAYHYETVRALGAGFVLGSDHYYNLNMDWNANNPTPKYALGALLSLESLRHMGFPPTVYELPAGSAADWPPIQPEDLSCCYMTNLAFGMKGLNYYVFTGGANPAGIGGDGDVYDYRAPIGPDGEIRPHYVALKAFGDFLRTNGWLAEADRVCDFRLGLDRELPRSKYYAADLEGFGSADAWAFLSKGLAITSLCASYSPGTLDLNTDAMLGRTDLPLLVASSENMAADVQRRLVRFVENGGRLLLAPVLPDKDEYFNPCTILADFLEGASCERLKVSYPDVQAGPAASIHVNGGLWAAKGMPAGASPIAGGAGQRQDGRLDKAIRGRRARALARAAVAIRQARPSADAGLRAAGAGLRAVGRALRQPERVDVAADRREAPDAVRDESVLVPGDGRAQGQAGGRLVPGDGKPRAASDGGEGDPDRRLGARR